MIWLHIVQLLGLAAMASSWDGGIAATLQMRTVDQCFGQSIPVQCDPASMVQVTKAFYRQSEQCKGSFHSNFCTREEPSNPACVGNETCIFTTPYIYLSPECGYSNDFLVSYKCVPASLSTNICSEVALTASSGYVMSPNYPAKYPPGQKCKVSVTVTPGWYIKVYLLDIYLAYYNYDVTKQCVDTLWVVGRGEKDRTNYLCSGQQRGLVFTSQANYITIYFTSKSHEYLNAKGFWLYYEAENKQTAALKAIKPTESVVPVVTMETMHGKHPDDETRIVGRGHIGQGQTGQGQSGKGQTGKGQVAPAVSRYTPSGNPHPAKTDSSNTGVRQASAHITSRPSNRPTKKPKNSLNIGKLTSDYLSKDSDPANIHSLNNDIRNDIPRPADPRLSDNNQLSGATTVKVNGNQGMVSMVTTVGNSTAEAERLKVPLWAKETSSQAAVFFKVENSTRGGIVGGALGCLVLLLAIVVLGVIWRRRRNTKHLSAPLQIPPQQKNYDNVILAYGSTDNSPSEGLINIGFERESAEGSSRDVSAIDSVSQASSNYTWNGTVTSWRGLVPIDEGPEIVYMDAKTAAPGVPGCSGGGGGGRRRCGVQRVKSKSMDDIRQVLRGSLRRSSRRKRRHLEDLPFSISLGSLENGLNMDKSEPNKLSKMCKFYDTLENLYTESCLAQSTATLYSNSSNYDTHKLTPLNFRKDYASGTHSPYETVHFQMQEEVAL